MAFSVSSPPPASFSHSRTARVEGVTRSRYIYSDSGAKCWDCSNLSTGQSEAKSTLPLREGIRTQILAGQVGAVEVRLLETLKVWGVGVFLGNNAVPSQLHSGAIKDHV